MQTHRANGIEFQIREGVLGNWDRGIVGEVHGPRGSAERAEFKRLLEDSFPHTDEKFNGADGGLSLAYGWR